MKFSQSSFVYFNYEIESAIRRLSRAGYQGVDVWGGRPHTFYEDMTSDRVESIKHTLAETGMEIPCFIPAQFRYPVHIASPYEAVRKKSVEYLRGSMDAARSLGCGKVSLCPGHSLKEQGKSNAMRSLVKSVHELIDYANDNGVVLLMEPAHPFETDLLLTVHDTIEFIEINGFDGMGICMDTGHCHINGEPLADTVREISNHDIPMHVHIDDNNGNSDDHLIPGEGNIDYQPFFQTLREVKYEGYITAELGWKYTGDPDQAVESCLVNLQKFTK